ncbi:MAG: 3-hydroxyisobutyrate dehydrogenase [Actinomycetota bacterium]|jgi:3-hydroxyisobutyrate dehydrogenase-like beta-hydroxyacid dehydrogenase|nr:3-hydroxyisobutyrate dehydrogenase [Actinomycetota bacterium]
MTKIAFIGLGNMGSSMASRLLSCGYDLTVWNRTPAKAEPLVARGARLAASPAAAVVGGVDLVVTMLTDPAALEAVLFGVDGLAGSLSPGQVLLDMSTVGPDEIRSVAGRLPAGVVLVDAPVRGSIPEAGSGRLVIFAGADPATFAPVEPVLRSLGTPTLVGGLGTGAAMKLVVNSTLAAAMTAAGEALALGDTLGLDRAAVLDVVSASPVGAVIAPKRDAIAAGRYPPSFKLSLARKDLALVTEATGLSLKVAPAALAWLDQAAAAGLGDLDFSAVIASITGLTPSAL